MNPKPTLDDAYRLHPIHARMLETALTRDGRSGERWRALRAEIDLDTFWDGKALDFLPLVYRTLVDDGVDHPDLPRLRGVHRRAWYDNQLRFRRLGKALRALHDAGVEAMVLKGVALALTVYPDVGLRPMADCDVLVRPGQMGRALAALAEVGWEPAAPLPTSFARHYQELDVFGPDGDVLDLHWHISQWLVPPGEEWWADEPFWDRSVPLEVASASARALDPTDSVLHALVHGARAGWRGAPQWVADAVMISRSGAPVDWDRIADVVEPRGLADPVRRGLGYLATQFGVPVPRSVLDRLDQPTPARARRTLARVASGFAHEPLERRWLGGLETTYRFWMTETAPFDRRRAVTQLPSWLADHWRLDRPAQLPRAVASRVMRRATARATVSTPPAP